MPRTRFMLLGVALAALATGAAAQQDSTASASLMTADGEEAGTATFQDLPAGVLIEVELMNMTPGEHGIHIHETGACTPDFSAAGEHFAPGGESHGFAATESPHPGDLPNIFVMEDGTAMAAFLNDRFELSDLFDEDGSALIVHTGTDTYGPEPGAGDPEACGVIEPSS